MIDPVIDKIVTQNCDVWKKRMKYVSNLSLFRGLSSAVPVCWFGDLDSKKPKIITIGTNPSRKEFIGYTGPSRFGALTPSAPANLFETSCNDYFKVNPYKKWFDKIEPLLNLFDASYYGKQPKIAIHLDIVSLPVYKSSDLHAESHLIRIASVLSKDLLDHLISHYNVEKIVIVGGYNYKLFIKQFGAICTHKYNAPYTFSKSSKTVSINFVCGCYNHIPFLGTGMYLPNTFLKPSHPQLYHDMTLYSPHCTTKKVP